MQMLDEMILEHLPQLLIIASSRDLHITKFNQCADSDGEDGELRPPLGPTITFIFFATVSNNDAKSDQSLPFVKCSPVWKFIKSMEIFQKMPQKPHFSPLFECKEETREGLAIGHMVTFSNVLERTSKPKYSDPSIVIERKLKTLDALKPYGFDVGKIR
ncbi:hypothetical protein POM88_053736 [Heracleum sosnowskyi]|uniref:Uncharacterized protein n=1 Tax=Heracleum sosnowskyi TaxID=360622 RepID=A0AAD8LXB2_9APIA|nr:hypothetical protein POM88_053736 [Heracleum sosnowskyi]